MNAQALIDAVVRQRNEAMDRLAEALAALAMHEAARQTEVQALNARIAELEAAKA